MDSSFMWHPIMSGMRTRPMNNEAMGGASDVRSSAIRSPTSRSTWSACRRFLNPSSTTCRTRLSRDYGCIGVGRNDGKTSGEYAPIFYKKDRFILLDSGCFWLSETPDKPSVGWDAKYPRICSWAQLQDRNTGNTLYFLNTHFDHVGKQARKESACMIVKWIRRHSDCGETILVGDFNVDQRSESYQELVKTGFLTDSFEAGTHSHGCHRNGQRIRPAEMDRPAYRPRSGHSRHRSPPLRFANEPLLVGGLRGKSGSPPAVGPLSRQRIPNDSVTHIRFPREIHGRCSDR